MKKKIKYTDKKTKNSFGDILESCIGINPYADMFFKYNIHFFYKLYKDILKTMINYHKIYLKNQTKAFEKFFEINKPCNSIISEKSMQTNKSSEGDIKDNIDIVPASGHDIYNYLARYGVTSCQIQIIMKLDDRLNFDKLKRAVRLSVDVEPVFACRFIEDDPPYWKRLDNINEINLCTLEETDNYVEAVMRFLQSPLDMDTDPNVKVKLIRSNQHDILGVKINHACCDGEGIKEYVRLLSNIYSYIDQENGTFTPEPKTCLRKDQGGLFKELSIKYPELRWNPLVEMPKTNWSFPWKQRGEDAACFSICRLSQGGLKSIQQYGKSRGATVDDLILTALYRVMFKMSDPVYGVPMDITSTIDLRQYLPEHETQAIRNFSGGFITKVARKMNEPFDGTLTRVMREKKKIKEGLPGSDNVMGEEYVKKASFTYFNNYFKPIFETSEIKAQYADSIGNVAYPGVSNLGYISNSLIGFGKNVVIDAYIIPPVVRVPGFLLLTSSYNDLLTLSIGYYRGSIPQTDMDHLLIMVKNELIRGCISENRLQ